MKTLKNWASDFGEEYINRNPKDYFSMNRHYFEKYGASKAEMFDGAIKGIPINSDIKILEVGCNIGLQLDYFLNELKLNNINIYGIDINKTALNKAKNHYPQVLYAPSYDIPFKNCCFDIVFTSGLLIHLPEDILLPSIVEIIRTTKHGGFILGFEYFNNTRLEIEYRDLEGMMWKDNFIKKYTHSSEKLKLVYEKDYLFKKDVSKISKMFVLQKI